MNAPAPTITEKARQAWWLLEAADLRGLPAPRSVHVTDYGTTSLMMRDVDQLNTWAESIGADVEHSVDKAGNTHWTIEGELHEFPVQLFVVIPVTQAVAS